VQELLPWYVTGRLDADEQARVQAHADGCPECQAELRTEARLEAEVARLPLNVERGWADMRGRLAAEAAPARRVRVPMAWLGWGLAAALAVAVGATWLPQEEPAAYHALGAAPPTSAAGDIVVVFLPETTERHMREVLKASEARLADGPTATNGYVLRVAPARRPAALATLRADKAVVVAEPLGFAP
jgi:hypothetical protein